MINYTKMHKKVNKIKITKAKAKATRKSQTNTRSDQTNLAKFDKLNNTVTSAELPIQVVACGWKVVDWLAQYHATTVGTKVFLNTYNVTLHDVPWMC